MAQKTPNRRSAGATRKEISAETPELLAKYLKHLGQGDLLTQQEEVALSNRAKVEDGAGSFFIGDGSIVAQTIRYTVEPLGDEREAAEER